MSKLEGHSGAVTGVAWSAEGQVAICSEDRAVVTWGVAGGGGPAGKVGSPAGTRLANVPADATLCLGGVAGEAWRTVEHSSIQNDAAQATCRCCRMF